MKHFIMYFVISVFVCSYSYGQSTSYDANTLNISATNTVSIGANTSTIGANGVFIGHDAGSNSIATSFSDNTFVGDNSGRNTQGTFVVRNVGIGRQTLQSVENSSDNVAIGTTAGNGITNSRNNFFLGRLAGNGSTNSSRNVVIGNDAGVLLESSIENIMIGSRAGSGTLNNRSVSNNNIFIGYDAGASLNGAKENICIGRNSGGGLQSAESNVFIGFNSGRSVRGSKNILIGHSAGQNFVDANDKLIIENSSDFTTPLIFGDFSSNKLGINTSNLIDNLGGINLTAYSLYVTGGILSDEVRVRTGWADYVFDSKYELRSLEQVSNFIKENNRLPNMPSEEEVLKQGIEIGDITKRQQEKIEELTLYLIDQDEKIKHLETMIIELQRDIKQK